MSKSVYFDNCIRAIRHTTFGRDNRKPIADSICEIESLDMKMYHLLDADVEVNTDIIDSITATPRANSESAMSRSEAGLYIDSITLNDTREDDFASILQDGTYMANLNDRRWELNIEYDYTAVHDSYTLILEVSSGGGG